MFNQTEVRSDLHPEVAVYVDGATVTRDLGYDPTNMNVGFHDHAPTMAYYGELYARAEAQLVYAKQFLANKEAEIVKRLRATYDARGVKVAENRLEKEVCLEPEYKDAQWRYRDAKYVQMLMASIFAAFDHRRSMLLQNARGNEAQLKGPLRLSEAQLQ